MPMPVMKWGAPSPKTYHTCDSTRTDHTDPSRTICARTHRLDTAIPIPDEQRVVVGGISIGTDNKDMRNGLDVARVPIFQTYSGECVAHVRARARQKGAKESTSASAAERARTRPVFMHMLCAPHIMACVCIARTMCDASIFKSRRRPRSFVCRDRGLIGHRVFMVTKSIQRHIRTPLTDQWRAAIDWFGAV